MAKKHRVRARSRRSVEASRRATAPRAAETAEREAIRPAPRAAVRQAAPTRARYATRGGTARAIGAPSAALDRAAAAERAFVVKDFRRMAIVVVIALLLLVASGVVLSFVERA